MKWETVTSGIGQSVFALWNNGKKLVTLALNSTSDALRVDFEDEKRVFLFRKEGFLKNKTVLCNEYGIRIAHAGNDHGTPFIVLNDERFFYSVKGQKEKEVTIYKDSIDQPLAVCQLDIPQRNDAPNSSGKMKEKIKLGMLLAVCWHLFAPEAPAPELSYSI